MSSSTTEEKIDEIINDYKEHAGWARLESSDPTRTRNEETLKQALLSLIAEERAHERKISRQLYAKRNPQYTKQWMADYLGISRPTLSKWLNDPEQFTLGAIMKLQGLSTKQGE